MLDLFCQGLYVPMCAHVPQVSLFRCHAQCLLIQDIFFPFIYLSIHSFTHFTFWYLPPSSHSSLTQASCHPSILFWDLELIQSAMHGQWVLRIPISALLAGIVSAQHHARPFTWIVKMTIPGSSYFHGKHFTGGAISQPPNFKILEASELTPWII